jgi:hypothetical protein
VPQPTNQARARIRSHLIDTVDASEDLFHEHGDDCECEICRLVSNFIGSVRLYTMLLEIT